MSKTKRKFKKTFKFSELSILISGISLIVLSWSWKAYSSFKNIQYQTKQSQYSSLEPNNISIPKIGKYKVPIVNGGIVNGKWILTDNKVLYLSGSGLPGENFNTILYAHSKPELFGNLYKLSLGDKILLENNAGSNFIYEVTDKKIVNPNHIQGVKSNISNSLTLFTCNGYFDETRLIIKARMISS